MWICKILNVTLRGLLRTIFLLTNGSLCLVRPPAPCAAECKLNSGLLLWRHTDQYSFQTQTFKKLLKSAIFTWIWMCSTRSESDSFLSIYPCSVEVRLHPLSTVSAAAKLALVADFKVATFNVLRHAEKILWRCCGWGGAAQGTRGWVNKAINDPEPVMTESPLQEETRASGRGTTSRTRPRIENIGGEIKRRSMSPAGRAGTGIISSVYWNTLLTRLRDF